MAPIYKKGKKEKKLKKSKKIKKNKKRYSQDHPLPRGENWATWKRIEQFPKAEGDE